MAFPLLTAAAPIAGAAIGAIGSFFSGKSAADAAKENYKHRYQWQVQDLKKAGLNPMLAVQNSPGQPAQPETPNIGEAAVKGYSAGAAAKLLAEQYQTQKAVTNKTMAETDRIAMENLLVQTSPLFQSATQAHDPKTGAYSSSALATQKFDAELKALQNQGDNIAADTRYKSLQSDLTSGQMTLQQIEIKYADQIKGLETQYRAAMAKAAAAGVPSAEADAAFWKDAGPLGKLAIFLRNVNPFR